MVKHVYYTEKNKIWEPIEVEMDSTTGEVLRITGMPDGYFLRLIEKDEQGDFHSIDYTGDYDT